MASSVSDQQASYADPDPCSEGMRIRIGNTVIYMENGKGKHTNYIQGKTEYFMAVHMYKNRYTSILEVVQKRHLLLKNRGKHVQSVHVVVFQTLKGLSHEN